MYNPRSHSFCSEFYIVEKTIEVVVSIQGQNERIRIDALQRLPSADYSTRAYIEDEFTFQPTLPKQNGQFIRKPESHRIWVVYDLPWVHANSADAALRRALSFLKERCSDG